MKPLWYAETVGMDGTWLPQTTPYQPATISRGGHLREAKMGTVGRRIRAIQPIASDHLGEDLTALQAIYGVGDQTPIDEPPA